MFKLFKKFSVTLIYGGHTIFLVVSIVIQKAVLQEEKVFEKTPNINTNIYK